MGILGRSHTPEEKAARKAERLRKRVERIRETEARERAARTAAKKSASGVQQLAAFGPIEIRRLTPTMPVKLRHHEIGESRSLSGAKALIEAGEALEARITATRIVLTGVFALAWRKKKGGESWLTIEGPGFFWVEKVERGQMEAARLRSVRGQRGAPSFLTSATNAPAILAGAFLRSGGVVVA